MPLDRAQGRALDAPSIDDLHFADLLALEPHGADTFVGIAPRYPWGRLFGGQVVAQALTAAQRTVAPEFTVHSLHAYFLRGGQPGEPVRLEVDRLRNGRSFATRQVTARQSSGAILGLAASFQVAETEADVQPMPAPVDLPPPEEGEPTGWGGLMERRVVRTEFARTVTWLRLNRRADLPPSENPVDAHRHAIAGLAFLSDGVPTGAVRAAHPIQVPRAQIRETFVGASLDHTVYVHRPVDPYGWLVADMRCHDLVGGRGVSIGNLYDAEGTHALTIVQEVLLRERRAPSGGEAGLGGKES
ncbi:MAG: acyl-CoA thioesterase domain-containing protein [Actinomycetota bacterium]